MRAAEQEAGWLRAVVCAYIGTLTFDDQAHSPVPPAAALLAHDPIHAHTLDLARADPRELTPAWTCYRRALVLDADAMLPAVLRPGA